MGKRHLLSAYEALGGDQACPLRLEITRRPYFLAPRMLGQTLEESGPNRVWGRRWSTGEDSPVMQLGREAGFSFNRDAIMSDTMRSHRLILFAAKRGKGETMADVLATLYFEEGQTLAATATLLEAARRVGLPPAEVESYLGGTDGQAEVLGQYLRVLELGIPSIPCAIMTAAGAGTTVHGSASVEVFRMALAKLIAHFESLPADAKDPPPHKLAALFGPGSWAPSETPLEDVRRAFEADWQKQRSLDGGTDEKIRARM